KCVAILLGEIRALAGLHAGGRADADVHRGRQAVRVFLRPFRAALAKALVAAADDVINARWPVPRRAPVPFHVTVETEQLAVLVEIDVVGVALAAGEQFGVAAVPVEAHDVTPGRLAARAEPVA